MHPNGTFGNLDVEDNAIGMTQFPYKFQGPSVPTGFAVATYWPGNSTVGNLMIAHNIFTAPLPNTASPKAIAANVTAPNFFHMASLSVLNNRLVNFPHDGQEYNITKDRAYDPSYTNAGNVFSR
jgi:hypothetical protein